MTFPNAAPPHEVTPAERRRSARFFWLILLLFPTLLGTLLAFFAFQGRQVRDYGQAVLKEVAALSEPFQGGSPCQEVSRASAPTAVKSCMVSADPTGRLSVVIETLRGQEYRLNNPQ